MAEDGELLYGKVVTTAVPAQPVREAGSSLFFVGLETKHTRYAGTSQVPGTYAIRTYIIYIKEVVPGKATFIGIFLLS